MENQKVLSNIHQLQYPEQGQNYVFNGCMKYLMECLGEKPEYDYFFFSFMSGDCVTQVFGENRDRWHPSFSQTHFDEALVKRVFDSIGYAYTYVDAEAIRRDPETVRQRIVAHLDKGLPVIGKGFHQFRDGHVLFTDEVSCFVGYADGGRTFFRLPEEATDLMPVTLEKGFPAALVFAGEKVSAPSLAESYRNAFLRIPELLALPSLNGVHFGTQAFAHWADALEGDFYRVPEDGFDAWRLYTVYVCNVATNLFSRQFVAKVLALHPELAGLREGFDRIYGDMEESYATLKTQGGEFNVQYATLQDEGMCKEIAATIRRFGTSFQQLGDLVLTARK